MNIIHEAVAREHICNALVLFAFVAVTAPGADAKHRAPKPAEQPAAIVAHVPLAGSPTNQMNLQENGGKQYLYIGANSNQGVIVVDVTNRVSPTSLGASPGRIKLRAADCNWSAEDLLLPKGWTAARWQLIPCLRRER